MTVKPTQHLSISTQRPLLVLTGGGSIGHVSPSLAIAHEARARGWELAYIGSEEGIEREVVEAEGIRFYPVPTDKLRRDRVLGNLPLPYNVARGVLSSYRLIRRLRPRAIFAPGGFVAVPVVAGAWLARVPCALHENDLSRGLANKMMAPFARVRTATFDGAWPGAVRVGPLLRRDVVDQLGAPPIEHRKPRLTVFFGSQGSTRLNVVVRAALPALLLRFDVVHACGRGNVSPTHVQPGYEQHEYLRDLPIALRGTSVALVRGGANSLWELIALRVPHVAIPLPRSISRGDQIENVEYFARMGCTTPLSEEDLNKTTLVANIEETLARREETVGRMKTNFPLTDGSGAVSRLLSKYMEC